MITVGRISRCVEGRTINAYEVTRHRALGDGSTNPTLIGTVRAIGYRLILPNPHDHYKTRPLPALTPRRSRGSCPSNRGRTEPMILVRLMCGLGNQMFQYAAARRLAEVHRTSVVIDTSWYDKAPSRDTPRYYELSQLRISGIQASHWDVVVCRAFGTLESSNGQ